MSEQCRKARRLWEEVFPAMDMEAVAEIVAVDSIDHSARPDEPQGIDGVRDTMRFLASAFSDQRFEVQRTIEQDDTVVVHLIHKGIHTGELMGIPATNRDFAYEHIHILRFEDGRAVEHWGVHDHLSFMQQIGVTRGRTEAATG